MSYDYFKHSVRDAYVEPLAWDSERFSARMRTRFGGRASNALPLAAWANLLILPVLILLFSDGVKNLREAAVALSLVTVGCALAYVAARSAFQHLRLEGNAHALELRMAPLPPRGAKKIPLTSVERIVAQRRGLTWFQRLGTRGRPVDLTYLPWTVVLETGRERVVLPLHLRPEDAQRLATDLRALLAEAKRRRAERGGFRG